MMVNPADMLTREFEINMVEVDAQDEPGSWWSLTWLGLAMIGMIWLIKSGGELLSSSSSRTSRAYDATEKKISATRKRIDADENAYDDVYENDGNVHQHIRGCC